MRYNFVHLLFFTILFLKFPWFGELKKTDTKMPKLRPIQFLVLNETTNGSVVFNSSHFHSRNSSFSFYNKFKKPLYTPCVNFKKDQFTKSSNERFDEEEKQYESLSRRIFHISESGQRVCVIQPYIKWGPQKKRLTTPDFQLEESVALIESMPNWYASLKQKVPLMNFKRSRLIGKGKTEEIKEQIEEYNEDNSDNLITAVFVSINMLNRNQRNILEEEFKVPVFDRYNIVIQIFRKRATTKEAKLQVALAEIPFVWYNIKGSNDKGGEDGGPVSGSRETILDYKKRLVNDRKRRIKKKLKQLQVHRNMIRTRRKTLELPSVAVVGYTNAGKTSLIKALTEEVKLEPRNHLFATLDVTAHEGLLPSNIKVIYMDTIGFISDIPTSLIEPFKVTLEDAVQADVIVHVLDVSNPDMHSQYNHVIETLKGLNVEEKLLQNIISVANKVDKINLNESDDFIKDMLPVSSLRRTGLNPLVSEVERVLLQNTGRIPIRIRVWKGSEEYYWLFKETSIFNIEIDPNDSHFAFMYVVITNSNLSRFKKKFNCSHD